LVLTRPDWDLSRKSKEKGMKVFITGGTGFVGKSLAPSLLRAGHEVTVLSRSGKAAGKLLAGVSLIEGDPTQKGSWQAAAREHDVVINLAGPSIFTRWTEETKRRMRESRIMATRNVVDAAEGGRIRILFSTSAVGYYGFHGDEVLTEESPPGSDFLAQLAQDWEKEAWKAAERGCRVVITRFGIVLGEKGGALGQMIPLFEKYLGGPMGSGKQWFSWIQIEDLIRAFLFLMDRPEISGPVNFTSPNPVQNRTLATALGKAMHRPSFFPAPGFMLRLILGEFGAVLLEGQRVIPRKLLNSKFEFRYPEIDQALENILGRR
jgi:uncharacterized protein (TIGR01777 family)